jgi:hypothetical protein
VENRIYVQDGHVFTSAGATTGIDLVLQLISLDEGPELALQVARKLVVYFRRSGAYPQLSPWLVHRNHVHSAIHRTHDAPSSATLLGTGTSRTSRQSHALARDTLRGYSKRTWVSHLWHM